MKNIVFIGGILSENQEKIIIDESLGNIDSAANVFQKKILNGLKDNNIKIISSPFIGSFPTKSKILKFKNIENNKSIDYIDFINIVGFRNLSRYINLNRYIKKNKDIFNKADLVIVYSFHNPFLQNLRYIKKINSKLKVISIVPDLPQFMNLNVETSWIYRLLKKIDIKAINNIQKYIDGYVLLTRQMYEKINNNNKPYVVIEGIADDNDILEDSVRGKNIILMYSGTLNKKYGILDLLQAFSYIKEKNINLLIYGDGDAKLDVLDFSNRDNRIKYMGHISHIDVMNEMKKADILINPRKNEDFVKYSFPSKILEYLSTGKPVISYKLSCFEKEYNDVLFFPEAENAKSLYKTICKLIKFDKKKFDEIKSKQIKFISNKNSVKQCDKIIKLLRHMEE